MHIQGMTYHIGCVVCSVCGRSLKDKCYAHYESDAGSGGVNDARDARNDGSNGRDYVEGSGKGTGEGNGENNGGDACGKNGVNNVISDNVVGVDREGKEDSVGIGCDSESDGIVEGETENSSSDVKLSKDKNTVSSLGEMNNEIKVEHTDEDNYDIKLQDEFDIVNKFDDLERNDDFFERIQNGDKLNDGNINIYEGGWKHGNHRNVSFINYLKPKRKTKFERTTNASKLKLYCNEDFCRF